MLLRRALCREGVDGVPRGVYERTPEARAGIAAAARRRCADPAERAKMSEANRLRCADPAVRARMSEVQRGRKHTPESRAKMSVSQRLRWADPVELAKMSGERSPHWAGNDVGYTGVHRRAKAHLAGKPCAMEDDSCRGIMEVAFRHDAVPADRIRVDRLTGLRYSSRAEDYWRLCHSHHGRYDADGKRTK